MKYIVDINSENMRLDKFIRKYSEETSLSVLFSLIRKGLRKIIDCKKEMRYIFRKVLKLILKVKRMSKYIIIH